MEIFFRQTDRQGNAFFSSYRRLNEIHEFVDKLSEDYPNITEVISVGKSSEGRDLKAIKIGSKTSTKSSKSAIWIDGGIHAREWISPATVTYIAYRLTNDYSSDEEVKDLVDHFDWYILPVVNPDGYEFSHNFNRMWRKSRRGGFIFCKGVDLNRNFGFHWKEGGSSSSPCSDTYAGSQAFSEPETKAISDYLSQRKENFIAYLAVHSYSQLWLTPWGWTSDLPDDYDQMVAVAQEATQALSEVHGTKYRIGSSTNILYVATGGADDWAYGSAGIKYSYTLELRDTGRYGFLLPSEQIIPTGEETFAGIKAMAKAIKREA
ncbi:carboxypeptidase B-like [Stegodyphus dumicola]|uniref:carboxypeptidase B-like n=1 Tax=Stegodyphus dumicola TaxID=202533 RepID=UPI0015A97925|nr:carboxypeptidase B-like [Stegodyphus dumicola]